MPETKTCPKCSATVGTSAPFGLCPKCLVEAALTEDDAPEGAEVQLGGDGLPFEQIDRYRLVEKIGEGAFGEVFAAEQGEPVERKVAIKILKRGMDSAQVSARFEAERQALALMNHPNVATVLDGGETEDGRPYFVMELVGGQDVTGYCEAKGLGLRARIELFIAVCEGVTHAHGRGIIHRDLKPANVLVEDDGAPVPKVIDFGIAKATERLLTTRTVYTELGRPMGTPAYMSPEQAESRGADVDVRTDVYSLGVLLYELLTGTPPFDDRRLREAGAAEMERILREEEPARPSTRIGSSDSTTTLTRRAIGGDLDWIVMRAIEKERERRYASVADFARDLRRFLDGAAIEARPPSTTYRLRKWARKHCVPLAASAAVFVALAVGTIVSTAQMRRAVSAERAAEERLAISEAFSEFIEDDFIGASLEDGLIDLERGIDVLVGAEEKIEGRLTRYPEAEAGARLVLARTYYGIGINIAETSRIGAGFAYRKCKKCARRAFVLFGEHLDDPGSERRYIGTAQTLARALLKTGDEEEALDVVGRAFAIIGDRIDLDDRNQMELAKAGLEAASELRDLHALQTSHARFLGWTHTKYEMWDSMFRTYKALARAELESGNPAAATVALRRATIIGRMLEWGGFWIYRGRNNQSLRSELLAAGVDRDDTAFSWETRLAEWNLEEVADGFALPPEARAMVLAFLLSESGNAAEAAELLMPLTEGEESHPIVHARAFALEGAGDREAAIAAAADAVHRASAADARFELGFYAGNWARLRRMAGVELKIDDVPWSEPVTFEGNGHRYSLIEVPMPFQDAVKLCEERGGHLATSTDAEENQFLYENFGEDRLCWLGATDAGTEGKWRWITGEPFNYTNWAKNQPNGESKGNKGEDFLNFGTFDGRSFGINLRWAPRAHWGDDPAHGMAQDMMVRHRAMMLMVTYPVCEWDD